MQDYCKLSHPQWVKIKDDQQLSLFQHTVLELLRKWKVTQIQADRLFELEYLSFDPLPHHTLDPVQEGELIFLLSLLRSGFSESQLKTMLTGLKKPYSYPIDQMVYDFAKRKWFARLPIAEDELTIEGRIKRAKNENDARTLREMIYEATKVLASMAGEKVKKETEC